MEYLRLLLLVTETTNLFLQAISNAYIFTVCGCVSLLPSHQDILCALCLAEEDPMCCKPGFRDSACISLQLPMPSLQRPLHKIFIIFERNPGAVFYERAILPSLAHPPSLHCCIPDDSLFARCECLAFRDHCQCSTSTGYCRNKIRIVFSSLYISVLLYFTSLLQNPT